MTAVAAAPVIPKVNTRRFMILLDGRRCVAVFVRNNKRIYIPCKIEGIKKLQPLM